MRSLHALRLVEMTKRGEGRDDKVKKAEKYQIRKR